ncbi:FliI/YscN family ATPase [Sphingosinicella ginsenosidimutans]|uniref:Flagellum-specific ATP synthase n=1 Tax=Allosphingosinicella ginsenosidimutans TaxID=1176539 RepID=A0A5C6TTN1_9SPHN|nr:FliI/YscN family ATPase [Sphingosinicella ginsenosidimutans]TXC63794.1 FliI/YscN family ATPase [Sphingosinicella ginsenosidimutans]
MSRLAALARDLLEPVHAGADGPRRVGRLAAYDGLMLEATGLSRPIGSGARVATADGHVARAEVVGFRGERTLLMALDGEAAYANGARVEPDASGSLCEVGPALLGRVVDGLGQPLDGLGPIGAADKWPLAGRRGNPLDRARVLTPFDIGVRAVNALLTAGVGQRIAIVAGSGVGKSVLMGQMIAGAEADVIVVGLIGERSREVSDFLATKLPPDVRSKSVVVAVPADHAPLLRLRAAMRATAIAEDFRARGLKVLLLIDSLTRVAHAQREIGLSLGEPPTVKGYPPSALGLIPRLVERAGADARTGGSITALYTVLADGDDTDDPIVDAARAIVDGHIILSRSLAEQSVYPAIDVGRSLSRVMADIVTPAHAAAAAGFRRLWSVFEENRDLILMGAYAAGGDPMIDEAIVRRPELLDFLKQTPKERIGFDESVAALQELMK